VLRHQSHCPGQALHNCALPAQDQREPVLEDAHFQEAHFQEEAMLPDRPSYGGQLFQNLMNEAEDEMLDILEAPNEHDPNELDSDQDDNWDNGEVSHNDEEQSVELPQQVAGNVLEPSTVELPEEIKRAMFQTPLTSDSLWDSMGTDKGVHFTGKMWDEMDPTQKTCIDLLNICKGKEVGLVDKIMKWMWRSLLQYNLEVKPQTEPPTREASLSDLMDSYGYKSLKARKIEVTLPRTGKTVKLMQFPFGPMLASLLSDPVSMQPENITIDPKDPFKQPKFGGDDGCLGDFNTGEVHCNAWKRLCGEGTEKILAEISIFVDKTHLDARGKHTLEPIIFTTGVFNADYRNKPESWRPLGYIPNMDHIAPHAKADDKLADYHYCIRILVSELVAYQRIPEGIKWKCKFGNEPDIEAKLQIPVNCISGDTEGHDKLAARITDRSGRGKRGLCRYCRSTWDDLADPYNGGKAQKTKCTTIRRLRNSQRLACKERLDKMDYKDIHDGLVEVHFSDPKRGLNGCCPAEILHCYQCGLCERTMEAMYGYKKLNSKVRNRGTKRKQRTETDLISSDENSDDSSVLDPVAVTEETTRNRIFNPKSCARLDEIVMRLHKHLRWQSDQGLPRTAFPLGVCSIAKMEGHERSGVLLLMLITMVMEHWAAWRKSNMKGSDKLKHDQGGCLEIHMGKARAANVVKSLFLLVSFEAYLKCKKVQVKDLHAVETFIPHFLDQLLRTFPRTEGVGDNIIKNHLFLHLVFDLRRLAMASNFTSGVGEMVHKTVCKETGRRTNMHASTFEENTAKRYVENLAIRRSHIDHPDWTDGKALEESEEIQTETHTVVLAVGKQHHIDAKKGDTKRGCPSGPTAP
jgi:hypothetical protein